MVQHEIVDLRPLSEVVFFRIFVRNNFFSRIKPRGLTLFFLFLLVWRRFRVITCSE